MSWSGSGSEPNTTSASATPQTVTTEQVVSVSHIPDPPKRATQIPSSSSQKITAAEAGQQQSRLPKSNNRSNVSSSSTALPNSPKNRFFNIPPVDNKVSKDVNSKSNKTNKCDILDSRKLIENNKDFSSPRKGQTNTTGSPVNSTKSRVNSSTNPTNNVNNLEADYNRIMSIKQRLASRSKKSNDSDILNTTKAKPTSKEINELDNKLSYDQNNIKLSPKLSRIPRNAVSPKKLSPNLNGSRLPSPKKFSKSQQSSLGAIAALGGGVPKNKSSNPKTSNNSETSQSNKELSQALEKPNPFISNIDINNVKNTEKAITHNLDNKIIVEVQSDLDVKENNLLLNNKSYKNESDNLLIKSEPIYPHVSHHQRDIEKVYSQLQIHHKSYDSNKLGHKDKTNIRKSVSDDTEAEIAILVHENVDSNKCLYISDDPVVLNSDKGDSVSEKIIKGDIKSKETIKEGNISNETIKGNTINNETIKGDTVDNENIVKANEKELSDADKLSNILQSCCADNKHDISKDEHLSSEKTDLDVSAEDELICAENVLGMEDRLNLAVIDNSEIDSKDSLSAEKHSTSAIDSSIIFINHVDDDDEPDVLSNKRLSIYEKNEHKQEDSNSKMPEDNELKIQNDDDSEMQRTDNDVKTQKDETTLTTNDNPDSSNADIATYCSIERKISADNASVSNSPRKLSKVSKFVELFSSADSLKSNENGFGSPVRRRSSTNQPPSDLPKATNREQQNMDDGNDIQNTLGISNKSFSKSKNLFKELEKKAHKEKCHQIPKPVSRSQSCKTPVTNSWIYNNLIDQRQSDAKSSICRQPSKIHYPGKLTFKSSLETTSSVIRVDGSEAMIQDVDHIRPCDLDSGYFEIDALNINMNGNHGGRSMLARNTVGTSREKSEEKESTQDVTNANNENNSNAFVKLRPTGLLDIDSMSISEDDGKLSERSSSQSLSEYSSESFVDACKDPPIVNRKSSSSSMHSFEKSTSSNNYVPCSANLATNSSASNLRSDEETKSFCSAVEDFQGPSDFPVEILNNEESCTHSMPDMEVINSAKKSLQTLPNDVINSGEILYSSLPPDPEPIETSSCDQTTLDNTPRSPAKVKSRSGVVRRPSRIGALISRFESK